jgi:hypothetical protein
MGFVEVFAATDEILAARVTHSLISRAHSELSVQIGSAQKQIRTEQGFGGVCEQTVGGGTCKYERLRNK